MRLPPYSADIVKARRLGHVPVPGVFGHVVVLPTWKAETTGAFIVCPDDVHASVWDFFFLAGLDVSLLVRPIDEPRLVELVHALLAAEPRSLLVLDMAKAHTAGIGAGVLAIYTRKGRDIEQ